MSSLAGDPLRYQLPSAFIAETTGVMNPFVVQLPWCGLSLDTRRGYTAAIHSYEYFCAMEALTAWPATSEVLYEWVSARVNGHRGQAKVQENTVEQYLSALRSHHIDLDLPVTPFEDARFRRILAGAKRIHTPY